MRYERRYFIDSTVSNYKDYRAKKFDQQADDMEFILQNLFGRGFHEYLSIIDFGCATGGLIKAMKEKGFQNMQGTDISHWAIDFGINNYGLERELQYYNRNMLRQRGIDVVLFMDVLEHIPEYEINFLLEIMAKSRPKNIIVRIPVAKREGRDFYLDVSRNDKTHINCHSKNWWIKLFEKYGFKYSKKILTSSIYDSDGVMCGVFKWKK